MSNWILYGIAQCDQVKKAKKWLQQQEIEYQFHDFRKQGLSASTLTNWLARSDWQSLFNKRSSSYRALDEEHKQQLNQDLALQLMQSNPTLIKRPVLATEKALVIGFNIETYQKLLERTQ